MLSTRRLQAWALATLVISGPAHAFDDVRVTNVTSSSATITWSTESSTDGCVDYGLTPSLGQATCDSHGDDDLHYVTVTGLDPATPYFFSVTSGGTTDDNGGSFYTFTTASVGAGVPYTVWGSLNLGTGSALVSVSLRHPAGATSSTISTLVAATGSWLLNLGNLKDATGSAFAYATGDTIDVRAHVGGTAPELQHVDVVNGMSPQEIDTTVLPVEQRTFARIKALFR